MNLKLRAAVCTKYISPVRFRSTVYMSVVLIGWGTVQMVGHAVAQLVEALEGCGFHYRQGHWDI